MKNLLLVNSLPAFDPILEEALTVLQFKGWNFYLWSAKLNKFSFLASRLGGVKNFFGLAPGLRPKAGKNNWLFRLFLPFLSLLALFRLAIIKRNLPFKKIIAIGLNEKFIFSFAARRLKLEMLWIELPENDLLKMKGWILKKYLTGARQAKIIVFSGPGREKLLRLGVDEKNIRRVSPGVKLPARGQSNLFASLAESRQYNDGKSYNRKFFTIGAMADLNRKHKIEILFQAAAECVSAIPNLQLIIIGSGREKNNLSWAAKKLKIDNRVWLIFEPPPAPGIPSGTEKSEEHLKIFNKWLPNFEIFASINEEPRLADYTYALLAMARGIPVIAPVGLGFEDFVVQNKTGTLLEMDLSEMLARQIIRLYQNTNMRFQLGENAARLVDNRFLLDNMVENMEEIFKE